MKPGTKERSSDMSETERLLNVEPEVILGSLTAGYIISDDCQTLRLHNTGKTPNLGAPLDTNQYELQNKTINTKRQTRFFNNIEFFLTTGHWKIVRLTGDRQKMLVAASKSRDRYCCVLLHQKC